MESVRSPGSRPAVSRFARVCMAGAVAAWLALPASHAGPPAAKTPPASPTGPAPAHAAISPDALGFDEIVFVKRKPYSSDHYYTDINNGTSADRFVPGNGIYVYNLRTRRERPVVTAAALPGGNAPGALVTASGHSARRR